MNRLLLTLLAWIMGITVAFSQAVVIEPAEFTMEDEITITVDLSEGCQAKGNLDGSNKVYIHTGVGDESNAFEYTIGNWGMDDGIGEMTSNGDGTYSFTLTPNEYYGVPANELINITKMGMVFRDADGTSELKDNDNSCGDFIFNVKALDGVLAVNISPENIGLKEQGDVINFEVTSTMEAFLRLTIDGTSVKTEDNATSLTYNHTVNESGQVEVAYSAFKDGETVADTITYFVAPSNIPVEARPAGLKLGANYHEGDPTKVTLVLQDPAKLKEFVYAVGDFNNWVADESSLMKLDNTDPNANYFWLEITGLTEGEYYVYQYNIDGVLDIADPYTSLVYDPFDDKYINDDVVRFPNLPTTSKELSHRASVFQTGQEDYVWEVTDFVKPAKESLLIYELHIRDFTEEDTYQAAMERLDYIQGLGINCIELMPVNEFEGNDSWGYNPNFYFAPDKYYGTPNDLKKFIDEAHKRGMAVVIDMVLNHSYHSSPFVRMYNTDNAFGEPTADNPWFNESANFCNGLSWGADFNHESEFTRALVDTVNAHWLEYYKVDGFRFDFTKGFSNTDFCTNGDEWGNGPDQDRISNLERMASEIWDRDENAYVILEHLADWEEERQLAAYEQGMMLWTGAGPHHDYVEAGRGGTGNFSNIYHETRDLDDHALVSYMESHDEQRVMYVVNEEGRQQGSYNLKELPTGIDRMKLNAGFFFMVPGPHMIWQFEELGYDVDIDFNGRVGRKPVKWEYADDPVRYELYEVYSALMKLRNENGLAGLAGDQVELTLEGAHKEIVLKGQDLTVVIYGNYGLGEYEKDYDLTSYGTNWYNFFEEGNVVDASGKLRMAPGQLNVFVSDNTIDFPRAGLTDYEFQMVMTDPNVFTFDQDVTFVFDASLGDKALENASEVVMVAGVIEAGATEVSKVVDDNTKGQMTQRNDGRWELTINPATYFDLSDSPDFVEVYFRNADGSVEHFESDGAKTRLAVKPDVIYAVGTFNGWDVANGLPMESVGEKVYEIELDLTTSDAFKFTEFNDWSVNWGGTNGVLELEGGDIKLPTGSNNGIYKVTADIGNLTYAFELIEDKGEGPQVVTFNPSNWNADEEVTISIDVSGTDMEGESEAYLWAWMDDGNVGAPTNGEWGSSAESAKLVDDGNNILSITMTPTEYYGVTAEDIDTHGINFLVKTKSGSAQTTDFGPFKPDVVNGVDDELTSSIVLYPVPASDKVYLKGNTLNGDVMVKMLDLKGTEVLNRVYRVSNHVVEIDLGAQNQGIYIILVGVGDKIAAKKIMIE